MYRIGSVCDRCLPVKDRHTRPSFANRITNRINRKKDCIMKKNAFAAKALSLVLALVLILSV
ncbi:MAG: hypothetical protein ACI4OY_05200, partial [Aristaeellaceae bacterium]